MAQTDKQLSARNLKLEISTNGSTWTNISGHSNMVTPDGGDRQIGETYTYEGDTPLLTAGKREPVETKFKVVYTEEATDAFEVYRIAFEAGTDIYVRWSPKGGTTGNFQFATGKGICKTNPIPEMDGSSPDAIAHEFTVVSPSIAKAAVV